MSSVATPPGTTLSTPSPTERTTTMPPPPPSSLASSSALKPIYVIVATTTTAANGAGTTGLGIGLRNNLPWPSIRSDMAFFRNTTVKTRPAGDLHSVSSSSINAVIMGRKTWDSIPARFRPLSGRVNVVISRSSPPPVTEAAVTASPAQQAPVLHYPSLESALAALTNAGGQQEGTTNTTNASSLNIGNIFILGGAQIYAAFLSLPPRAIDHRPVRILQTQVRPVSGPAATGTAFECDTFFPIALGEQAEEAGGFSRVGDREVSDEWLRTESGEPIVLQQHQQGQQQGQGDGEDTWLRDDKAGVEVRVVGWERR